MKLSDLDPCLWQYDTPASTSSTFEFPELQPDTFAELKPLPPFEFPLTVPAQQAPPPVPPPSAHYDVSTTTSNIKTELAEYLLTSDIDDIAALIGSAIAEQQPSLEPVTSSTIDPWTELDAWIESACQQNDVVQSSSTDFALPSLVTEYAYSSTNSSPILQARLNQIRHSNTQQSRGDDVSSGQGSSMELIRFSSYDLILDRLQSSPQLPESTSNSYGSLKVEACYSSVEPHVSPTVTSTSARFKKSYNRNSPEQKMKKRKKTIIPMTIEIGSDKEKPIHRCAICNRGFLNKSNIKVHLRTHTGEKPFKCEVCGKAFRQKAHLLKHVQIHKRITRD